MDSSTRHEAVDYARMIAALSALLFAIMFTILVIWVVTAQQDAKLYESDNVVCASQPFSIQCFERKAR